MTQYAYAFDSNKCSGCRTCQVLCKETYELPLELLFRRVINYTGGSWEKNENGTYVAKDQFGYFVSMGCNHCADPACVRNCPTAAMTKDPETGIVTTDHDRCIGCRSCQMACPYGAPAYDEANGYMLKCDMCRAEIEQGGKPLCVSGCRDRALDFGTLEEMVQKYGEGDINVAPLQTASTDPAYILVPHVNSKASGSGAGVVADLDEELDVY